MKTEKGFIPVMLTPFTDSGEIDYPALTRLTEVYLGAGAAGLFANCLSGEMFELTGEERIRAIRHVVKTVNGAVPVVATGTFGGPVAQQADFAKRVYDCGAEAVIGITGLLAGEHETDEVFNERVLQLFDLTPGIPMGFYECPVPYKRLLSASQVKQFVDTGRLVYHKDTCLDIEQVREKIAAGAGRTFGLYDAYMVHAVESLKAGSAGLSCIQGNFFPEMIAWLCKNYGNETLSHEVDLVQQFLVHNMDVMHHVYPVIAKYYLSKRGIGISTFTRRKVGEFTPTVKKEINSLYDRYRLLEREVKFENNGH
ncbi:dihydrodipicolinate synthase family protein [Hufsiella ginkgonis]|uniref:Dihydrodipicolinate synthase family protein n=1 Tax=Hufsiella ginkgonis TaxID=2695274 RepID=A0A7K1XW38_9SPHI|nr:dihydrodipicolinate synthase family protein [Hufsiella ginkgonis]MXV15192.1 dihydrodipicolinate synthase family protein [Hufsiella ginkgonis]